MKKYLMSCAYDGSDFAGWQYQKNKRCVQSEIEKAIACFDKTNNKIVGCSRTDAGVHALGQRFHWETELKMESSQIVNAVNSHLPSDIRVTAIKEVPLDFHARYDAIGKAYRYLINNGEYNVLTRNYQSYVRDKLDIAKMQESAELFIGVHDFTTFCATRKDEKDDQVRELNKLEITKIDEIIELDFEGNGFLRYMVRMLSQTLIEVGRGRISKAEVARMLAAKDKKACRYNGKPQGLYLVRIDYEID